jgi:hypothetical protein
MTATRIEAVVVTAAPAREPDVCHTARLLVSRVARNASPRTFEVGAELAGERPRAEVHDGAGRSTPRPKAHHAREGRLGRTARSGLGYGAP